MGTGARIQRAGRLIGHYYGGLCGNGAGDGNSLLLSAGHLCRAVVGAISHVHPGESLHRHVAAFEDRCVLIYQGQLHIFYGLQLGDEVVALKNEAYILVADLRKLTVAQLGNILAIQRVFTVCGNVQAAENIHKRRFSGTGCTDNRHELAPIDGEGYAVQCADFVFHPLVIYFIYVLEFDKLHIAHHP